MVLGNSGLIGVARSGDEILTIMLPLTIMRAGFTSKFRTLPVSSARLFLSDEVG